MRSHDLLDHFHQIFTIKWSVFDRRLPIWPPFPDGLRDVAMATIF